MPTENKEEGGSRRETNSAYSLSELAGLTSSVVRRILLFSQISLFVNSIFMHGCDEFSVKNFQKRLIFHFQNDRSGQPVLTFGKGP